MPALLRTGRCVIGRTCPAYGCGTVGFPAPMEITPDQMATLQLLLVRGQSYADLAKVLGVDEDEIRSRARRALTELGGADPDRHVGLTDYLLGQADPIGRADASRHLRDDPADHALATALCDRLRQLYSTAVLPRLPGEARRPRTLRRGVTRGATGAAASTAPLGGRLTGLSQSQTRLMVILGSAAVLLIAVVLAIAGVFGGAGDEDATAGGDATSTTEAAPADERAVPIQLEPVGNSDAGGVVVFGFATADQPFIEFQVRDLEPPTNDAAYVLWFLSGEDAGFPLPTPLPVQSNGTINERIPVPAEILAFVAQSQSVTIALNDRQKLDREIAEAVREGSGEIPFPGGSVLAADIPRAAASGGGGAAGGSAGQGG